MTITGIGVDLVKISKIKELVERWGERFLKRVFTDAELAYALGKRRVYEHLAARFAAKEAFIKAQGQRAAWKEIEVARNSTAPYFLRLPAAQDSAKVHLSLAHLEDIAIATVIIEKE